jgi:EAL domain-containing protein (putative c-di-GMP-specific phosphodiesterase class I)
MLKQADVALYRAKDSGRNQFHFHSDALDVAIIERVTLAGDLRRAVERHEIELYYQPQVEVRTGRIAGVEALARWHHPTQGMLWPGRFIPVAEQTDTIVPLGRWIIDDACRQIAVWRAKHLQPERVAINVSALQIKAAPGFDRELMECLERWAIPPDAVEIELTESVLMETTQEHRDIISRLRALGIAIAIDDFGTGYSSLSYLRAYSVSHIKIAQEFIQHLKPNSGDVEIVRAAIGLGHALGIQVIAEGVETEFQLGLLTEAGCELIQGYYYSPPVTAAQMTDLLRTGILRPAGAPDRLGGQ